MCVVASGGGCSNPEKNSLRYREQMDCQNGEEWDWWAKQMKTRVVVHLTCALNLQLYNKSQGYDRQCKEYG